MLRFVHLLGWLLAVGTTCWVLGFVVLTGMAFTEDTAAGVGIATGLVLGALLSWLTWARPRSNVWLWSAGTVLVVVGALAGAAFLGAAEAQHGRGPYAGFGEFLLAVLGFAVAAVGVGLVMAGVSGHFAHRDANALRGAARGGDSRQ